MPISVKMEIDMMDFSPEDRKEYLEWYWITENPTDKLIKECYDSLWLQYYFTAWEIEVRAWTIQKWWKAPQAAGRIHTDFEKKFIKADVVNWKDLVDNGWWSKAREVWKVKMEWKEYVVQDWDVMLFKFWG
jgi:ribosome-binding ATPase YchF (GTP1/OBG family)